VRIGGLKGFMDGSAGSRTAFFFDAYDDSAGYRGLMQNSEADMRTWIGNADSAGLQVAVHAIGDRANAILLAIYDSVTKVHGTRDRRFRVEHAQHLRRDEIPMFGRLRVVPSMQPYHAIDDGRWSSSGSGRSASRRPTHSVICWTPKLPSPSDPTGPWRPSTRSGCVRRRHAPHARRQEPTGWVPEQKITVGEALHAYTAGNAWAVFADQQWGTLAPGTSRMWWSSTTTCSP